MNQDETPTPKQSGSYAMMQGVCEDSLRSLERWRVKASADSPAKWLEVRRFAERFTALLADVKSWGEAPPGPEAKARTIREIFAARDEASAWGARWGWEL